MRRKDGVVIELCELRRAMWQDKTRRSGFGGDMHFSVVRIGQCLNKYAAIALGISNVTVKARVNCLVAHISLFIRLWVKRLWINIL